MIYKINKNRENNSVDKHIFMFSKNNLNYLLHFAVKLLKNGNEEVGRVMIYF
jgi:hypothetical protein